MSSLIFGNFCYSLNDGRWFVLLGCRLVSPNGAGLVSPCWSSYHSHSCRLSYTRFFTVILIILIFFYFFLIVFLFKFQLSLKSAYDQRFAFGFLGKLIFTKCFGFLGKLIFTNCNLFIRGVFVFQN